MSKIQIKSITFCFSLMVALVAVSHGEVVVKSSDREFSKWVNIELGKMRMGDRGLVCQELMVRLDQSSATTVVQQLTRDDDTWHPNDRKGRRSHVVAGDVKVRGAARRDPTNADVYVHPSHINPKLSSYKLGTFVYVLAQAADLNHGTFSGNYRIRERRFSFYRNAWRNSIGFPQLELTGEIPTQDYKMAQEQDLITEENRSQFPILIEPPEPPASEEEEETTGNE